MNFTEIVMNGTDGNAGFRETSSILLGKRRGDILIARMRWKQTGDSHSVGFDWETVLSREESRGDVVGFYHTHPSAIRSPSFRDDKTMEAWVECFGKTLVCVIGCDDQIAAWDYSLAGKRQLGKVRVTANGWLRIHTQ